MVLATSSMVTDTYDREHIILEGGLPWEHFNLSHSKGIASWLALGSQPLNFPFDVQHLCSGLVKLLDRFALLLANCF